MSDLVVFSHLRWIFVWQRPQQLISRLARDRRTWFVEEPLAAEVSVPTLRSEELDGVTRVWLEVPAKQPQIHFTDPAALAYGEQLAMLLGDCPGRVAWMYTPLALELVRRVRPEILVYDVMDDLASFSGAPQEIQFLQRQVLHDADLVFAGGRSLHRSVSAARPDAHLFPSGVEPEHYSLPPAKRPESRRPVAGYVGVIDERLDLNMIQELARARPDWEIRMVGPIAKIDERMLPRAENITYPGPASYDRLPEVMADFDVALMPFALNDATRSISPTKTLEYFAASLPVISTRVPDVVAEYGEVVALEDDAAGFARACDAALLIDRAAFCDLIAPILRRHHWDAIAARMNDLVRAVASEHQDVARASSAPA